MDKLIEHAASTTDNIALAKMAAEAAVRGFYAEFGWRVEVIWDGGPSSPARVEATSRSSSIVDPGSISPLSAGQGLPFRAFRSFTKRLGVK
jgi:hypothetical protein